MRHIDVAILGAGSAGLSARREVAKKTDDYLVIDPGPLGTTCARVGCMPSKVLIEAANTFHSRHKFQQMGISGDQHVEIDLPKVFQHVRSLRDRFVRGVTTDIESWQKTHLLQGYAEFVDHKTLQVGEEKIQAKSIIIATGSTPIFPQPWRQYSSYFSSTDAFFELENLTGKVAIIGLGVIGIELGQALSRLGVDITGVTIGKAIGGLSHPALQDYVLKTMRTEFPIYIEGVQNLKEHQNKLIIETGGEELSFDHALLALGRSPNLPSLHFERTGLAVNERGIPLFDAGTFRVQNSSIFIAGDVNAERPILHEASDEGRIAGYNAVRDVDQCFRRRKSLGITFSAPNIAIIGQSYQQLIDDNIDFVEGEVSFEGQGRAIVKLEEKGLLKVFAERTTGKLLGCELFAPDGEHLAHLISWALETDLTVHSMLALPFYHPVVEEGLRTALRDVRSKIELPYPDLENMRCQDPPIGA